MNYPYMPKSTALWLIENTALTFEQIADFCGLHELEVKNIADAETQKIQGLNPILNGQVTREDIALCESDPTARLTLQESIVRAQNAQNKKGIGYTPKILRQNRNKTHKSYTEIQIQSPIVLGLVSESALHDAIAKAAKESAKPTKTKKKK